jgi:signal transduction histidine kinase
MSFEQAAFDMNALAESCAKAIEQGARAKGVAVFVTTEPAEPALLTGDPTRIRQILLNLLSNAVKFTAAGRIELAVTRQAAGAGRCRVRLAVADTGIGIPADKMTLLFQRFSQIDRSDTRRYGGTGLGLAISKHLVEMMGGTIGVESKPGQGSLFWFELELPDAGQEARVAAASGHA